MNFGTWVSSLGLIDLLALFFGVLALFVVLMRIGKGKG